MHVDIFKDILKNEERDFLSDLKITIYDLHTRQVVSFDFKKSIEMFSSEKELEKNHKFTFCCISSKTASAIKNDHELFSMSYNFHFCKDSNLFFIL